MPYGREEKEEEDAVMKEYDVIGFGALNMDRLGRTSRIADEGEFVVTDETETPGGSAANTVCWLSELGLRTAYIGCVGDDRAGQVILHDLHRHHVDTNFVKIKEGSSGAVLGLVDATGNRALYVFQGVNNQLNSSDLPITMPTARYVHFSSFVGMSQLGLQISFVEKFDAKTRASLAPGMLYAGLGVDKLAPLLAHTSILFLNNEELALLVNQKGRAAADKLLDLGVAMVVITSGRKGSYLITREGSVFSPAFPAVVVDTVGAGDAFTAGFLYGLIRKFDPRMCLKTGNLLASYSIQGAGARTGIPTEDVFIKKLKEV